MSLPRRKRACGRAPAAGEDRKRLVESTAVRQRAKSSGIGTSAAALRAQNRGRRAGRAVNRPLIGPLAGLRLGTEARLSLGCPRASVASIPSPSSNGLDLGPFFVHYYGLAYVVAITA